jgi:hypothetical protein
MHDYKFFEGDIEVVLGEIIKSNRKPLSTQDVMQAFIQDVKSGKNFISSYLNQNYIDTCDTVLIHPDEKFKVVRDSELIKNINRDYNISYCHFNLHPDPEKSLEVYDKSSGDEFYFKNSETNFKKINPDEAKTHPLWNSLVPDKHILEEFIDLYSSNLNDENALFNPYISNPFEKNKDYVSEFFNLISQKIKKGFDYITNQKVSNFVTETFPSQKLYATGHIFSLRNEEQKSFSMVDDLSKSENYVRLLTIPIE